MRILVTGGAGFVGSHLVRALLARGDEVRVVDNLSTGRLENLDGVRDDVDLQVADIRDADRVPELVKGVDGTCHLAAVASVPRSVEAPSETADVNVTGTVRLIEEGLRAGAERFVFASSCAVYGDWDVPQVGESLTPRPLSPYAASKLAGEQFIAAAARNHDLRGVSLRFFNVHGPRQDPDSDYAAVIPVFAKALTEGRRPTIFGDGEQTRDFCHVDDVVRALLTGLEAPDEAIGGAFNVGTGRAVSLNELLRCLAAQLGASADAAHAEPRPGDLRHSRADPELADQVLGWRAAISLEDGLAHWS